MASTPGAGGPRHAGRIIDPLANEDGPASTEPVFAEERDATGSEAAGDAAPESPELAQPSSRTNAPARGASHPVRERLLARVAAARAAATPGDGEAEHDAGLLSTLETELDRVGATRAPASPSSRGRNVPLSPALVAVFGTLIGLVLVASLVALAMQLDRRGRAPGEAPPLTAVVPTAAPTAVPPPPRRQRKRLPGPWRIQDQKGEPGMRTIQGKIGLLPFLRAVQEAGVPKKEAYRVLTALKKLRNLDKCDKNDEFVALIERSSNRIKAFEYVVSKEEIYQAREGAAGLLDAKKLELHVQREQVTGAIQRTGAKFADDAVRGGFEPQLDKTLDKALEGHMGLEQLERGDVLRVIAQEVTVLGEFARYSGVEAVEYRPQKGEGLRVYYFKGPKSRGYYDQRGRALFEGGWRRPIKDAPITSRFNPKRLHPVLKKVMPHTGTDFGAPAGTPVGASSFGTVSFVGWAGPSGNLVKIDHAGGVETGYAHLLRFAEGLKVGDKVKRMQIVGYVGSTGRSTGPHLHFSAKRNGEFFDPETLNFDAMRVLPAEERELFAETRKKYDAALDAIQLPAPIEPAPAPTEVAESQPDLGDEPDLGPDDTTAVAAAVAVPAKPAAAPPLPAAPARATPEPAPPAAAPRAAAAAVYLSDKELLKLQGASDDGEIED